MAFDDVTLEPDPNWTDMDEIMRVASYDIERGRSYELDRVDTGRATITINDIDGLLDPTNPGSPFTTEIQPLKQARLAVWDPVREDWFTRFRGFVESYEYEFHPSQLVNVVTINLVDIFEIVAAVEMFPGFFGHPIPDVNAEAIGQVVFFEDTATGDLHGMKRRVEAILSGDIGPPATLGDCGIDPDFYDVFSGNVSLHEASYSPGASAMEAIQEAVDAEFPGVGNVYGDRLGRLCVHGRYARFDPVTTSQVAGDWDFRQWKAGDGAAVLLSPTDTAHIRAFAMSRDLGKVINHAMASPKTNNLDPNFETQVVQDNTSKGLYGIRPWSTQNLLTKEGVTDGLVSGPPWNPEDRTDWDETKLFAHYYVDNYKDPETRISRVTFRSQDLDESGAAANWEFLSECDLNDWVSITIASPGGGSIEFDAGHPLHNKYFIEGIHEEHRPLNDTMDDVTLTIDLSPADYFSESPFSPQPT